MTAASPNPQSPTPRRRSPWVYIALGCSLLFVLTVGGCIAGITLLGQRIATEANKPIDPNQVIADLGDVPVYRPSELDLEITKAMRASLSIIPVGKPVAASFRTPDSMEQVVKWYQEQLPDLGYQPAQNANNPLAGTTGATQLQFVKDNKMLLVQSQTDPKDTDERTLFSLFQIEMAASQSDTEK